MTTHASPQTASAIGQVFDHHLGAFAKGLDELMKDYDESSVLITPVKTYRGTGEIRAFFAAFLDSVDPGFWPAFTVTSKITEGEVAYLVWEAKPWVQLGTDTFVFKAGKIAVQTLTSFEG